MQIDAGGLITADYQGYTGTPTNGNGPGGGTGINADPNGGGGGGAYGGHGGAPESPCRGGLAYGSLTEPVDLGSAGGAGKAGYGGVGGGAIRFVVTNEFRLEGRVSASGGAGLGDYYGGSGGGAGGSIWITAGLLSGAGTISADGGTGFVVYQEDSGGGAGGRISILYSTNAFGGSIHAYGGGGYQYGGAGTIYLQPQGGLGILQINNAHEASASTVWNPMITDALDQLTVGQGRLDISGPSQWKVGRMTVEPRGKVYLGGAATLLAGRLHIQTNGSVICRSTNNTSMVESNWVGSGPIIRADEIIVDQGGHITADYQGYTGTSSKGNGPGGGAGINADPNGGGGGGAYGGNGGAPESIYQGGLAYGSLTEPIDLGSAGGAGYAGIGGVGGGSIRLVVTNELRLNGSITAIGGAGLANYYGASGGGAGGSIWITTGRLSGNGTISADGGAGQVVYQEDSGGGAGGRIAVYYHDSQFEGRIQAFGGSGSRGGAGTLYLESMAANAGALIIDNNNVAGAATPFTITPDLAALRDLILRPGARAQMVATNALRLESLQMQEAGLESSGELSLPELVLDGGSMTHTGRLTVDTDIELKADAVLTGIGTLVIPQDLRLLDSARISHGAGYSNGLHLDVGRMILVDTNAAIDVSAKGYGPASSLTGNSGGSYGGLGTGYNGSPNPVYGNAEEPITLGSGGGGGTRGGGRLWIETPELVLEGQLLANGQTPDSNTRGGGSGGSILVETGVLRGQGWMRANGANRAYYSGAGGGGRIAIYCWEQLAFPTANITVNGGSGAGQGTVVVVNSPTVKWADQQQIFTGLVELDWEARALNPHTTRMNMVVSGQGSVINVAAGAAISERPVWNTIGLADGRYRIKVVFTNSAGSAVAMLSRDGLVNNTIKLHTGHVTSNEVWSSNIVHVVDQDLILAAEVIVEPGAVVKIAPGSQIIVAGAGKLEALGTAVQSIIFTSLADDSAGGDSNVDGLNSLPRPGDWAGIAKQNNGQVVLNQYVELRFIITVHQGVLADNESWLGNMLHLVAENVTVPTGRILTIERGAVVKFERAKTLTIQSGGKLLAIGTVAEPITITSIRDDTAGGDANRDGRQTTPAAGDWGWIFVNGGEAVLDHCQIRYGAGPSEGGWGPPGDANAAKGMLKTAGNASLSVSNSVLSDAFYDGVLAWGGEVDLVNSVFAGMDRAISAHPNSRVEVLHATLDDNGIGLLVHGGVLSADNSIIAHSRVSGIQYDFGTLNRVRYCNVWSPEANSVAYRNTPNQTGLNGNISADPKFKNRTKDNWRLTYLSPCVDAADGLLTTPEDITGAPRFTYLHSTLSGIPMTNGVYTDMGAYELVDDARSEIDLVVTDIQGPASVLAGDLAPVEWKVSNRGNSPATGPWHDAVHLFDPTRNKRILAGEFLVGHDLVLGPGQTVTFSASVRVPGGLVESYRWEVLANSQGEIFEGQNRGNNATATEDVLAFDLPTLAVDGPALRCPFENLEDWRWFKMIPTINQDVFIRLELTSSNLVELYVGLGYLPSPENYDYRHRELSYDQSSMLVANAASNVYYILARPRLLAGSGVQGSISAVTVDFSVNQVVPAQVGNAGTATVEIRGANLQRDAQFYLQATNGQRYLAQRATFVDSGSVFASFDLAGCPPGWASVVVEQAQASIISSNLVNLIAGGEGGFYAYLTGPKAVRVGRPAQWQVTYGNRGLVDVPLPLLCINAPGSSEIKMFDSTLNWASQFVLLALHDRSLLPTLGPGQEMTMGFEVTYSSGGNRRVDLAILTGEQASNSTQPFDWLHTPTPPGADEAAFRALLQENNQRFGRTIGEYYQILMQDLEAIGSAGLAHEYRANINGHWLLGYEPVGAPILVPPPLPDTPLGPQPAAIQPSALPGLLAPRPGDGIRNTYVIVIADEDYGGEYDMPHVGQTITDLQHLVSQELRISQNRSVILTDRIRNANDTLTPDRFLNAIREARVDGDDQLLIFYNGHGSADGTIALHGGRVTASQIQGAIDQAGAGTTCFVNDSCYAGRMNFNIRPTHTRFVGLAASHGNQFSYGDRNAGGVFTSFLKHGLRQCQGLGDAFFGASDGVNRWSDGQQMPDITNPGTVDISQKPWSDPTSARPTVAQTINGLGYAQAQSVPCAVVGSIDPNDKSGPNGIGPLQLIMPGQLLTYTIYFENKTNAQAPAQEVMILDDLDAQLDWTTFEPTAIGFNDVRLRLPAGRQSYTGVAQVLTDTNLVHIQVTLDLGTGRARWHFESRDPATGQLPEDPWAGFLPPNNAEHQGEGYVSFTILSKTNLTSGVVIQNQASILFDPTISGTPALDTPTVFNTLDATPPASAIEPLPEQSPAQFVVRWQGRDEGEGSGIASYDIYVSRNDAPFESWLTSCTETQAAFTGEAGAAYRFYSVAQDQVGNRESVPAQPDASTQIGLGVLRITHVKIVNSQIVIDIENLDAGKDYTVETCSLLPPLQWQTHFTFTATNRTMPVQWTIDPNSPVTFFRVRTAVK